MATRLRGLSRAGDATAGLPHYFSVLAGRARPHYQLCKFIPVPESVQLHEDGEEELWRVHEQLMHVHEDLRQHPVEPNACPVSPHLLDLKCELAHRIIRQCCLCENACGDDRTVNTGKCGVGERPKISSHFAHHGEEEELVPSYTTFFSGCNFMCQFCQNCDISQNPQEGTEFTPHEYAQMIPRLTKRTHARNLNWVGGEPTPNAPFILDVLNALPVDFNLSSICTCSGDKECHVK